MSKHIFPHSEPFLHSSELFSGEVTYFKPPLTKLQYQPQDSITLFLAQHLLILCVILPTHDCTESAEIFGVSLCIRLIEGCYVRMSTFLRKKRELFNLHGCKVKFEIVMGMFLFLRTRCLMFLKRERTFSWLQKTFMFLVSDSWLFSTGIAPDVKLCELKIFRGELKKTPTSCLLCWPNLLCWNS